MENHQKKPLDFVQKGALWGGVTAGILLLSLYCWAQTNPNEGNSTLALLLGLFLIFLMLVTKGAFEPNMVAMPWFYLFSGLMREEIAIALGLFFNFVLVGATVGYVIWLKRRKT